MLNFTKTCPKLIYLYIYIIVDSGVEARNSNISDDISDSESNDDDSGENGSKDDDNGSNDDDSSKNGNNDENSKTGKNKDYSGKYSKNNNGNSIFSEPYSIMVICLSYRIHIYTISKMHN